MIFKNVSAVSIGLFFFQCTLALDFKMSIVSIRDCILSDDKYDKPNLIAHTMSAYKIDRQNTRLRANMSVPHKIGPMNIKIHLFEVVRNLENHVLDVNQTCNGLYFATIITFLKLNFTSDCEALPGIYTIDNLDIEVLHHLLHYVWSYGRYGIDMNFHTDNGTVACIKVVVDFVKKHS